MHILALVGGGFVLLGWLLWFLVRRWDRTTAILQAATPLPIKMLNVWDVAWVRGAAQCPQPLAVPHFHHGCLHFSYKLEEQVTRTRKDSQGKTVTERVWETRQALAKARPFAVRQDDDVLRVDDVDKALWHYEAGDSSTVGNWRHTASFTPYPGPVSVVGVVDESRQTLGPFRHVPLMITPLDRPAYLTQAIAAERWGARFGLVFLFLGFALALYGLLAHWIALDREAGGWWHPGLGLAAGMGALSITGVLAGLRVYNSVVILKVRVDQSWSGIDVLLEQRYNLIPNLVSVTQAYMRHEKDLLDRLAEARTSALTGDRAARVGAEGPVVASLTALLLRAEAYPDLRANEQFAHLARQITALEDKIAHARGFFNDSVQEYNTQVSVFPASLIAALCGFRPHPLFVAELPCPP